MEVEMIKVIPFKRMCVLQSKLHRINNAVAASEMNPQLILCDYTPEIHKMLSKTMYLFLLRMKSTHFVKKTIPDKSTVV